MALKSTVYKVDVQIADMDRNYYQTHALTLACHPSETEERLMVRVLAFVLHADEHLAFGKGLTDDDEPELWIKDLTGNVQLWLDIGQPEEKQVRRACGRAKHVYIYCYSGNSATIWWEKNRDKLTRCNNLSVINLPHGSAQALAKLAQRSMQLQCTIQDGLVWLSDGNTTVEVGREVWK